MLNEKDREEPRRDTAAVPVLAVMVSVSIAMVALLFIIYLDLLVQAIRLLSGIPSVIALFGLVVLGLVALTMPIAVGALYRKHLAARRVLARFLLISGVQGWLLLSSELFRRWLLGLIGPEMVDATLGLWNDVALVAGVVIGVAGVAAGAVVRHRYRVTLYRR